MKTTSNSSGVGSIRHHGVKRHRRLYECYRFLAVIVTMLLLGIVFPGTSESFVYVFGDNVVTEVTPSPEPEVGQAYIDGSFHTTVTRVTPLNSTFTLCTVDYSTNTPVSTDNNYLYLYCEGNAPVQGGFQLFNAKTGAWIRSIGSVVGFWNSQNPEPRWDTRGNPSRLYYRKDMQLRYYDVADSTDHLVHNFSIDFPSFTHHYIYDQQHGTPSFDQRYWVYAIRDYMDPYHTDKLFVYDLALDNVVSTHDIPSNIGSPHAIGMSLSGNYVFVAYYLSGPTYNDYTSDYMSPLVYTRDFTSWKSIKSDIPHFAFGYDMQGNEIIHYQSTKSDNLQFMRLDTGDLYPVLNPFLYGYGTGHGEDGGILHAPTYYSFRGWAFLSTYISMRPTLDHRQSWKFNQLFALELDESKLCGPVNSMSPCTSNGSARIWRIAHLQNLTDANYYTEQPNAAIDWQGQTIWWGTDWFSPRTTNPVPFKVYKVTLPPTWYTDFEGTITLKTPLPVIPMGIQQQ